MEKQFDALQTILSLPVTVGPVPGSWRGERMYSAVKTCECCGNQFRPWMNFNSDGTLKYYQKEKQWEKQRFCSISCSKMLENPMFDKTHLEKMKRSQQRRAIAVRGGNGQATESQQRLHQLLGDGWIMEYSIITTSQQRNEGAPKAYKVDLGMPEQKWAIELDGRSHQTLRIRAVDKVKIRHLVESGWKVLRLSNSQALSLCTTFR